MENILFSVTFSYKKAPRECLFRNGICLRGIERFSLDCRKGLVLVLVLVLLALWLASVFTLVLVLRQSSENRSNLGLKVLCHAISFR